MSRNVDVKKKHLRLKFVKNNKKAPFLEFYGAEFNSRSGGLWRTFVKFLVQRATLWNKARGHQVAFYQGCLRDRTDIFGYRDD